MDLVSIIVPIYNTEKYLPKCLDSIINQTYKNIEILLVNDGSPDNSDKIMKEYEQNDNRVKCLYKKNGGLSDARNYGLRFATGKYVCFVDSDDWVSEFYVEKLVEKITSDKSDIAVCEFDRVYNSKKTKNTVNEYDLDGFKVPAAWNKIYLKSVIDKYRLKFPVGKWYEDLTMSSMYIMTCKKKSIVKESLYFYRQNDNSIMHTFDDRIFQIYDSLELIEKFAKKNNLYKENKEGIEFAYIYHVLVGTLYRASFMKKFDKNTVNAIVNHVERKYPLWYNNKLVKKNLSFPYKTFLFLIKAKKFGMICFLLKRLNKYMYL